MYDFDRGIFYGALNVVMLNIDKISTFGAVSRGRHVTHGRVITVYRSRSVFWIGAL